MFEKPLYAEKTWVSGTLVLMCTFIVTLILGVLWFMLSPVFPPVCHVSWIYWALVCILVGVNSSKMKVAVYSTQVSIYLGWFVPVRVGRVDLSAMQEGWCAWPDRKIREKFMEDLFLAHGSRVKRYGEYADGLVYIRLANPGRLFRVGTNHPYEFLTALKDGAAQYGRPVKINFDGAKIPSRERRKMVAFSFGDAVPGREVLYSCSVGNSVIRLAAHLVVMLLAILAITMPILLHQLGMKGAFVDRLAVLPVGGVVALMVMPWSLAGGMARVVIRPGLILLRSGLDRANYERLPFEDVMNVQLVHNPNYCMIAGPSQRAISAMVKLGGEQDEYMAETLYLPVHYLKSPGVAISLADCRRRFINVPEPERFYEALKTAGCPNVR